MKKIAAILFFALALASCEKASVVSSDGKINCVISADKSGFTKGYVIDGTDGITGINYDGNKFTLDGWVEEDGRGEKDLNDPHYLKASTFENKGTQWTGDGNAMWRRLVFTNFWAVFPKGVTGLSALATEKTMPSDDEERTPYFTYDMSSLSKAKSVTDAAERSKDVLVAYCRQKYTEEEGNSTIKLNFKHALSAVKMVKGTFPEGTISDVTISGVHLTGECTLSGTKATNDVSFSWTPTDTPAASNDFSLQQNITLAEIGAMSTGSKVFFMIPQEMPSTASLSVTISGFTGDDAKFNGVKTVPLSGYSWKPGKEYTYTLSYTKASNKLTLSVSEYNTSTGEWTN